MKKRMRRLVAVLLATAMVVQQGSTLGVLAVETEPISEVSAITAAETQISESETKAEAQVSENETKAPETQASESETKAAETQASESETKAAETQAPESETKAETQISESETKAPETQASEVETQTSESETKETATESESDPETAEKTTESETATEQATETEQVSETVTETEMPTEEETAAKAEAELEAEVTQEVFQQTTEDAVVPMVKYTVKLTNKTAGADAEGISLKVVLDGSLSYKKQDGESLQLVNFDTLANAVNAAALGNVVLSEEQKAAYADGSVVVWNDQTVAGGTEKEFVFFAEVKGGEADVNALRNLWFVNDEVVKDEQIKWVNAELLEVKKELPSEFVCEGEDGMVVTATLSDPGILPEGAQFVVKKVELTDEEIAQIEATAEGEKQLANYAAYDMHFELNGVEVEPQGGTVSVKVAYEKTNDEDFGGETLNADAAELQVIHLDEQTGAEDVTTGAEVDAKGAVDSAEFVTDSFSVFVLSQMVDVDRTFVYEDDDVKITAVVDEDEEVLNSNLAELKMEIVEDRDSKEYKKLEKAVEEAENDNTKSLLGLRAYKFSFLKDGEEIEPTGKIEVTIKHKTSSIPEDIAENSVDGIEFYQITKKGKVKALEAETKTGRYNAVKKATMLIDGATLIETINDERIAMSRGEILSGLGIARNFGIFAINYYNTQDMEGCIAVKNLMGFEHQMGPSTNSFNAQTTVKLKIVKKAQKPGTYSFGIYVKDGEEYREKTSTSITLTEDKKTADGWYEDSVYVDGKTLPSGEYYVFEKDADENPIQEGSQASVNGSQVTVTYGTSETTSSSGSTGIFGVGASFIENFYGSGSGDKDTFKHETLPRTSLVIGENNTISDKKSDGTNPNTGEKYIVGPDNAWYKVFVGDPNDSNSCGVDIQRVEGTFPINFETEMSRLEAFSVKLANVASSATDNIKVLQIPVNSSGQMTKEGILINGKTDSNVDPFNGQGIAVADGELLVVNVDCTKSPESVNVGKMIVNGVDAQGWLDVASNIIWNFYVTGSDGSVSAFTGTVKEVQNFGTVLAPKASFESEGLMVGSIIVNTLKKHGNEIHHKQLVEYEKTIERKVECINTSKEEKGNLQVTKTVAGNAGDKEQNFNFKVELSDKTVSGTYGDMTFTNGVSEFTLKDGESKTAKDLPAGVKYTVTETEANKDGYVTEYTGKTGTIPANDTAEATVTNTKDNGGLIVKKIVAGNKGDRNKEFHFTVTLSGKSSSGTDSSSINGKYGDMEFTNGVATFTLKHDESKKATGLPVGVTYTVTEAEADTDGYVTKYTGETGTINEGTQKATFTNTKEEHAKLSVQKTVTGNAGDTNKEFHFTVTLAGIGSGITGTFGSMTFTNGVAEFTLKHNETKTAENLPAGVTYTVIEKEADTDGYTTSTTGESGTLVKDGTTTVKFVNNKELGSLTVKKSIEGDLTDVDLTEDQKKAITFEVYGPMPTESGASPKASFNYAEMKDGSITIPNLVPGKYVVKETNGNVDGYTVETTYDVSNGEVTFTEEKTSATVTITNTYTQKKGSLTIKSANKKSSRNL